MAAAQQPAQRGSHSKSIGHYVLGKTIGEGTFGKVKLGRHILSGERVAVKILEKDRIVEVADVERIAREVHILKLIRHPHIVQLYEIIETRGQLYLIMEYASGGELFDYIVASGCVQEPEACHFFQQIIAGVEKIHAMRVVHRDLKPENLLLDAHKCIKIVDFGLSNVFREGQCLQTACGSPCYAPPEMVAGLSYVPAMCDLWSCGVILFALVCGHLPFEDQNTTALYKKILAADYTAPRFISDSVRDLIAGLLTVDPVRRFTIAHVRQHPWYRQIQECSIQPRELAPGQLGLDEDVLRELDAYGFPRDYAVRCLELNKHNHLTTTYYLLVEKRRRVLEQLNRFAAAEAPDDVSTNAADEAASAGTSVFIPAASRPASAAAPPASPRAASNAAPPPASPRPAVSSRAANAPAAPTSHPAQRGSSSEPAAAHGAIHGSPTTETASTTTTLAAAATTPVASTTPRSTTPVTQGAHGSARAVHTTLGPRGIPAVRQHCDAVQRGGYPRVAPASPYSAREARPAASDPRFPELQVPFSAREPRSADPQASTGPMPTTPREIVGAMQNRAAVERRTSGGSAASSAKAGHHEVIAAARPPQASSTPGATTPRPFLPKSPGRDSPLAAPAATGAPPLVAPAAAPADHGPPPGGKDQPSHSVGTTAAGASMRSISSARAPTTPRDTPRGDAARPERGPVRARPTESSRRRAATNVSVTEVPASPRPVARYCIRQPVSVATPQRTAGPSTPLSARREHPVSQPVSMSTRNAQARPVAAPAAGASRGPYGAWSIGATRSTRLGTTR